jgi:Tfp pilus assembly protein PilW
VAGDTDPVRWAANVLARLRHDETGVTLMETVVGATIAVVVFGATMSLYFGAAHSQEATSARTRTTQTAQSMLERMTREIRQSTSATVMNSQIIDLQTPVRSGPTGTATLLHVRYDCSQAQTCTRDAGTGASLSGQPSTVIEGVTNTQVFAGQNAAGQAMSSNPAFVTVAVNATVGGAGGTQPIDFTDGIDLRNFS